MKELKRLWQHPVSTIIGLILLGIGIYIAIHNKEIDMWSGGIMSFGAISLMGKDPKFIRKYLGFDNECEKDEDRSEKI